jgi:hypothetical protein
MISSLRALMEVAGLYRRHRGTASDQVKCRRSPRQLIDARYYNNFTKMNPL